jgi:hypothetical protein
MSTQAQQAPVAPPAREANEIKIVSHSNLFYWWPVWAVGFVMAFLTWAGGHRMAVVPDKTQALHNAKVEGRNSKGEIVKFEGREALVAPDLPETLEDPHLKMSRNKSYGVLFTVVLLMVIVITSVPLRGLWSVVVLVTVFLLSIIFALADWWAPILDALASLHIQINAAGYLLIATSLFIIWLVTFVLFDPQIYMVFTPGQLRVRQEIGGGEAAYDTAGMVIQKQRNDLFRHWILGLGSGDLIVNTSGATAHHFDLPNVLFVGYKVKQIENMLREKPVVTSSSNN